MSPHLAYDTARTIEEARRLWKTVDRPNILIKVPATEEGISAIETLLAEGININIKLMFSMKHYEDVAQAYLRALNKSQEPERVRSVASFFLSRITDAVDQTLDEIEAAWRLYSPLLEAKPQPQRYSAGTWGSAAADDLLGSARTWKTN